MKLANEQIIDEALLPLSDFLSGLTEVVLEPFDEKVQRELYLVGLKIDIPIDLDVEVGDDGNISLGGGPPVFRTETSYHTNYHQLKINIELNDE